MRASYNWLRELSGVDASPAEYAERLTRGGLEVEAIEERGAGLEHIVIAEVRSKEKIPKKDKLSHVRVFDGVEEIDVVCGAPNVPDPGGRVLFARVGAHIRTLGLDIGERKLGGILSRGMICSDEELDIGPGGGGIHVVDPNLAADPGTPVVEALGLSDHIFEIGLTPNRPDGLGHLGLARELCLMSGAPFTPPQGSGSVVVTDGASAKVDAVAVTIADAERCPQYGAGLVAGVRIGPSPFALRYRLHCLGVRPIHNVVDLTNLVMLEWGHPIHAFDLKKVRGATIDVRTAREGEKLHTLDGVERTLMGDDLLICDGEGPVAIAGVMGGANSEIDETTKDVLIECAYFSPTSVRRTSRRLGLHTDASHRFERGVDPNGVSSVLADAASKIAELAGGTVGALGAARPKAMGPATVSLRASRIEHVLGCAVDVATVERILVGVGCEVVADAGEGSVWKVTVPTHRPDITREVDLIEEVARVHGYDRIPTAVPRVRPSAVGSDPRVAFARQLRGAATSAGLHQAINYAFVSPKDLERCQVPTRAVPLENPLSEERSVLRTSLLPGLLANVSHAKRRQVPDVALFELGVVFAPSKDSVLAEESSRLTFVLAGRQRDWIGEGHTVDFYDGKGVAEMVIQPLAARVPDARLPGGDPPGYFHPRRVAELVLADRPVGMLGELHPDVADAYDLDGRVVLGEIDVEALFGAIEQLGVPQAKALPQFPASRRDMAMLVSDDHAAGTIMAALREHASGLAESVDLFDLYRGEQIPSGMKSLAFRITYRDPEATLTDKRVDEIHAQVGKAVEGLFSATLR